MPSLLSEDTPCKTLVQAAIGHLAMHNAQLYFCM